MEKYIYDNSNGLWYELYGDYYLPCLVIPAKENHIIGIWDKKHQQYHKEHCPVVYNDLVLSGKLHIYLADIDTQAQSRINLLIAQVAEKESIDERFKAQN